MENLLENDLTGNISSQKYLCTITWRKGSFFMDEPTSIGGQDLGPDPYTALLSSLASCTLSTLRMYIDRKGWDIPEINIALNMSQENDAEVTTTISRTISFPATVDIEIKNRLLIIAEKCPVSKILKNRVVINTTI
ncbi:OsmC family protein [Flavobacterium eburneipallidum]|uniref:OsmC family protein n=1 Tax=Flavobacterium eburneipallidum TaxID=3003263 RepID=UPI0022AC002A|nr:OsmC family protein [Flavobacterium eburneipallidum]